MTDYRLRNHDLLYADRGYDPLSWHNVAIFGVIAVTVMLGVVSYLTDHFNAATAGFNPAPTQLIANPKPATPPAIQLALPDAIPSGS